VGSGLANHKLEVFMYIYRHANLFGRGNPRFGTITSDPKGNILVYLVVVILIFGVLGVSLVSLFTTATSSSATPNDAKRARFIAESGIR
jgi:Tfp pilus assembly protein PilX